MTKDYYEIRVRLEDAQYFMDVLDAMKLAKTWYNEGFISHANFKELQKLAEEKKSKFL